MFRNDKNKKRRMNFGRLELTNFDFLRIAIKIEKSISMKKPKSH